MKNKGKIANTLFFLSLLCLFVICSVFIVSYQIHDYQKIMETNEKTSQQHTIDAYIRHKVSFFDREGSIDIIEKDNVPVLVLKQDETVTYLYAYQGQLKELYVVLDYPFSLSEGENIYPLNQMDMSIDKDLLKITLQQDQHIKDIYISLHCERGRAL